MAITVAKQVVIDSGKSSVVKLHLVSGAASDVSNQSLLDVSTLAGTPSVVTLLSFMSFSSDMDIDLHWDATANVDLITLPVGEDVGDFEWFGGFPNNAGSGITGDILFSTRGAAADSEATIILHLRKN